MSGETVLEADGGEGRRLLMGCVGSEKRQELSKGLV